MNMVSLTAISHRSSTDQPTHDKQDRSTAHEITQKEVVNDPPRSECVKGREDVCVISLL